MLKESGIKWHNNGNWGHPYREWDAFEDHYLCTEVGHAFYGKKVIVKCHGQGEFEVAEYLPLKSSSGIV